MSLQTENIGAVLSNKQPLAGTLSLPDKYVGPPGPAGQDGFSPIATVTQTEDGATISIQDANGTTTAKVSNGAPGPEGPAGQDGAPGKEGAPGEDGFSPIATVTPTENGATVSITDKTGTTTATITNGQDGAPGAKGEKGETGDSGVYIGQIEPTDPDVNVWIDPNGQPSAVPASSVSFDDTTAQTGASNVQDAIDYLVENGSGGGGTAADISFDNAGTGLAATNVQSALVEINEDLVGSEEVQDMIDTSTTEPFVSHSTNHSLLTVKSSEIYDGTNIPTLYTWCMQNSRRDFLLECDIDIPTSVPAGPYNGIGVIYRTTGAVNCTSGTHFKQGHTYSFMFLSNNATSWSMFPQAFVRNIDVQEIPYGQPILISPNANGYPRDLYQVVDVTPVVADGNEVSY